MTKDTVRVSPVVQRKESSGEELTKKLDKAERNRSEKKAEVVKKIEAVKPRRLASVIVVPPKAASKVKTVTVLRTRS